MEGHRLLQQIQEGMKVETADGHKIGTIRHVWCGAEPLNPYTPCEDETCLEVHPPFSDPAVRLYIPCSIVSSITKKTVVLRFDAETTTMEAWYHKAHWIPSMDGQPLITRLPKLG
jgi:hypothetical protein